MLPDKISTFFFRQIKNGIAGKKQPQFRGCDIILLDCYPLNCGSLHAENPCEIDTPWKDW